MKKMILSSLCLLVLAGCTAKKDMIPLGGSKADGTIKMGYTFGEFEKAQVDLQQASSLAAQKCAVWGYTGAEAFGGQSSRCVQGGGFSGCSQTEVSVEFQCIGGKAADN